MERKAGSRGTVRVATNAGACSARPPRRTNLCLNLQCPPEGGRYKHQNQVFTQTLQPWRHQGLKALSKRLDSSGLKARPAIPQIHNRIDNISPSFGLYTRSTRTNSLHGL